MCSFFIAFSLHPKAPQSHTDLNHSNKHPWCMVWLPRMACLGRRLAYLVSPACRGSHLSCQGKPVWQCPHPWLPLWQHLFQATLLVRYTIPPLLNLLLISKHLSTQSRLHLPSFTPMCTVISVLMTLLPTLIRRCYAGPALGSCGSSLLWQPIIRLLGQSDTILLTGGFNLVGHTDPTVRRLALTPYVVLLTSSRSSHLKHCVWKCWRWPHT